MFIWKNIIPSAHKITEWTVVYNIYFVFVHILNKNQKNIFKWFISNSVNIIYIKKCFIDYFFILSHLRPPCWPYKPAENNTWPNWKTSIDRFQMFFQREYIQARAFWQLETFFSKGKDIPRLLLNLTWYLLKYALFFTTLTKPCNKQLYLSETVDKHDLLMQGAEWHWTGQRKSQ